MALTGSTIASTYLKLLRANSDTMGADATASYIQDSADTDSALSISTTRVGIGNAAPDSLLEIEQGSSGGLVAFKVDNNDTDKVAVSIEAANIDADVMDISADAVTTANVIDITADALTTGSAAIFATTSTALASTAAGGMVEIISTGDTDTNANNLLFIKNDHADSTGTTALKIQQDSTGAAIDAGGGYIVNEQGRQDHVANTMPAPYYSLDGLNDKLSFSTLGGHADVGTGGMTVSHWLNPTSLGANHVGLIRMNTAGADSSKFETALSNTGSPSTFHIYTHNATWNNTGITCPLNVWTHVLWTIVDGVLYLYINGVSQWSMAHTSSLGDFTSVIFGEHSNFYEGSVSDIKFYNVGLSAAEIKELYSGGSVPFKYKGANQTDLVVSSFVNGTGGTYDYDTFDGADANGFHAINIDGVNRRATSVDEVSLVAGKKYRVTFDAALTSGEVPQWNIRQSYTTGTYASSDTQHINCTASNSAEFTCDATDTYQFYFYSSAAAEFTISNASIVPIGAVAEYDGSGVGASRWDDKSGNESHATVYGATVENAPADADSGLTYEEGTWTMTALNSVTLISNQDSGSYTKIGNIVHCGGQFQVDDDNSDASMQIILPFVSADRGEAANYWTGSLRLYNTALPADVLWGVVYNGAGTSTLSIECNKDNAASVVLNADASGYYMFQLTYQAA